MSEEEKSASDPNMDLWNQVCTSDPKTVKKMTHGAKLNAIDAHSQIQRATELWGPYGLHWGLKNMQWGYIPNQKSGEIVGLSLDAEFFYPIEDAVVLKGTISPGSNLRIVPFQVSSDMAYKPAGDCRKKLMTDVTTKALSKLGFNADVFLNKFSDSKYVEELKRAENVVEMQEHKDRRAANFLAAVAGITDNQELIMRVLGASGYESLDELTTTQDRKAFVSELRREVPKDSS